MGSLLHYAIVFLVVALVAAALGFGGVAGTAMEGARILFWVAIVLFVISLDAASRGTRTKRSPKRRPKRKPKRRPKCLQGDECKQGDDPDAARLRRAHPCLSQGAPRPTKPSSRQIAFRASGFSANMAGAPSLRGPCEGGRCAKLSDCNGDLWPPARPRTNA
jgi:uncharacterized membrane protein YtjA (UPF0391 family)